MMRLMLFSLFGMLLAACGEKDQSQKAAAGKSDGEPWQGAKNGFVVKGWTPGDKSSWEAELRTRAQAQNEYIKVN